MMGGNGFDKWKMVMRRVTVHTFIYMLYFAYSLYFIRKNRGYLDDNLI